VSERVLWPWAVVAVALLSVGLNLTLVIVASKSSPNLVRGDYYQAGIDYQREIDAVRALRSDWSLDVSSSQLQLGAPSTVRVCATDADGGPLEGAEVRAALVRTSDADADRHLELKSGRGEAGCYEGTTDLVARGAWDLRVDLELEGATARLEKRLWVSAPP
jgi:hypothetical protein